MSKSADNVKDGDYIVIQRQEYFKLHKVAANRTANLGKDVLDIGMVIGKPVWSTFRMEQKKGGKRNYQLKECSMEDLKSDSITLSNSSTQPSGTDNRNIIDDGSSQKLPMEEIVGLRDKGLSSKEIVGTLIENSKTFQSKTEYSQQKYLKKKEKKYFEYITVRKPTIRLIAEIMFRQDQGKLMGLRMDTLSQLPTAVNLHPQGTYILYESGSQGLAAAMLLNGLSSEGRLVLVHPGNYPQKSAVLALNLTDEQENSLISVNIYNLLRKLQGNYTHQPSIQGEVTLEIKSEVTAGELTDSTETSITAVSSNATITSGSPCIDKDEKNVDIECEDQPTTDPEQENYSSGKRKHSESGNEDGSAKKKSRWEVEVDRAASALSPKADGLVIVCREHPTSIVKALLPHVAPSRNFVVYGQTREPLQELFVDLGKRSDIISLRLTDSWFRNYQVESNRTHPLVNMTGSGGYLLTGVVVENS